MIAVDAVVDIAALKKDADVGARLGGVWRLGGADRFGAFDFLAVDF